MIILELKMGVSPIVFTFQKIRVLEYTSQAKEMLESLEKHRKTGFSFLVWKHFVDSSHPSPQLVTL